MYLLQVQGSTPSPVLSDWSSEDWDGEKTKAKEQKSLVDFMLPKQDTDPQTMEVMADDIPFSKLTIQSDDPGKNPVEVMNALIPSMGAAAETLAADISVAKTPEAEASAMDTAKSDNSTKTHYEVLSEQELRMQREEEKYVLFIGILGEEEESNTETDTDDNTYTYFN